MNKKAQHFTISSRTIIFTLGGGFMGFILFNTAESSIIGGLIGLVASIFVK